MESLKNGFSIQIDENKIKELSSCKGNIMSPETEKNVISEYLNVAHREGRLIGPFKSKGQMDDFFGV